MFRIVLLALAAAVLHVLSAQAHTVHSDCRVGRTWMGKANHFHPGARALGRAVRCRGGRSGAGAPRAPQPGASGLQSDEGRECYEHDGRRTCCPKGWTVRDGRCQPFGRY